jgi:hypothetical protein
MAFISVPQPLNPNKLYKIQIGFMLKSKFAEFNDEFQQVLYDAGLLICTYSQIQRPIYEGVPHVSLWYVYEVIVNREISTNIYSNDIETGINTVIKPDSFHLIDMGENGLEPIDFQMPIDYNVDETIPVDNTTDETSTTDVKESTQPINLDVTTLIFIGAIIYFLFRK